MLPPIERAGRAAPSLESSPPRPGDLAESVVPLPRLRLLRKLGPSGFEVDNSAEAPLPMQIRPRKMSGNRSMQRAGRRPSSGGTDSGTPTRHDGALAMAAIAHGAEAAAPLSRGRGLLRRLDGDTFPPLLPRAPPPLPGERSASPSQLERRPIRNLNLAPLQQPAAVGSAAEMAAQQEAQEARDRVREYNRQCKRKARRDEERQLRSERERKQRQEAQQPRVDETRREAARRAADFHRRARADKESIQLEKEEVLSARRQRAKNYATPDKIRELRRNQSKEEAGIRSLRPPPSPSLEPALPLSVETPPARRAAPQVSLSEPHDEEQSRGRAPRRQGESPGEKSDPKQAIEVVEQLSGERNEPTQVSDVVVSKPSPSSEDDRAKILRTKAGIAISKGFLGGRLRNSLTALRTDLDATGQNADDNHAMT